MCWICIALHTYVHEASSIRTYIHTYISSFQSTRMRTHTHTDTCMVLTQYTLSLWYGLAYHGLALQNMRTCPHICMHVGACISFLSVCAWCVHLACMSYSVTCKCGVSCLSLCCTATQWSWVTKSCTQASPNTIFTLSKFRR